MKLVKIKKYKMEEKTCKVCNKIIINKNKKYCCKECRYKDSEFKNNTWNKGLTKETNEKIKEYGSKCSKTLKSKFLLNKIQVWNKGLTKETNEI